MEDPTQEPVCLSGQQFQRAEAIGQMFVEQYYNAVLKTPFCLSRYYSKFSVMTYEGELSACHQMDMQKKLSALQFDGSRIKIRQIDSLPTMDSGVVVQVSGELLKIGHVTRRFHQTFVLAAKTEKQYYVLNDIFRFQHDDHTVTTEGDGGTADPVQQVQENQPAADSEAQGLSNGAVQEENIQPAREKVQQPCKGLENQELESNVDSLVTEQEPKIEKVEQAPVSFEEPEHETDDHTVTTEGDGCTAGSVQQVQENQPAADSEAQGLSNGAVQEENIQPAPENLQQPSKGPETQVLESNVDSLVTEQEPGIEKMEQEPVSPEKPVPETVELEAQNNKKMSFASVVKANASQSVPALSAASHVKPIHSVEIKSTESAAISKVVEGGNTEPLQKNRNANDTHCREEGQSNTGHRKEGDGHGTAVRRGGGGNGNKYPDNHQLFVGNLLHSVSEEELKVFFERWGRVLQVKINVNKGKGDRANLPNFGFVVFDNPAPVQKILQERPIFLHERRVNVEEKKARGSADHPSTHGGGGARGGRGGFRGGRGGPRGGYSNRGGMTNGN